MKTLRAWIYDLLTRHFLEGLVLGFLCGFLVSVSAAVWWAQDRSIVRAARWDGASYTSRDTSAFACPAGSWCLGTSVASNVPCTERSTQSAARRVPTSALLAP